MALVLQEGGIAAGGWRHWLGDVFSSVTEEEREAIVRHMLASDILHADGGVLGFGRGGERTFGRRHFLELVSAFTTPLLLQVRYGRLRLGEVDPLSVEPRGEEAKTILLGGRSWRVLEIDWPRRLVSVEPSSGTGRSRWFGISSPPPRRPISATTCWRTLRTSP